MGRASSSSANSRSRSSSERGRTSAKAKPGKKDKKDKKETRRRRRVRGSGSPDTASDEAPGGVAPAGSAAASASTAIALPTDNTVLSIDFINSLANSINGLTSAMKEVQVGMKVMQRESREQRAHIADIVTELQDMKNIVKTNNQKYESEMAALNTDIKAKLASLRASSGNPLPSASAAASASSSSAGPSRPPSSSATSTAVGPRPSHRPTRIWFKGFGETLTTKALNQFTSEAVARLPLDLGKDTKSGSPGFGQVAFVDFPPTAPITTIKQHLNDLKLQHTLENGEKKNIRIANDMPIPVRYSSKILGGLWQQVKEHLTKLADPSVPEPIQLSTSNGKLYLIRGARPLLLFDTHPDANGILQVTPKTDNLALFQITVELAEAWVKDAVKAASRLAPH
jgi:hypothetical protein